MTATKSSFADLIKRAELAEIHATSMQAVVHPVAGDASPSSARDKTTFAISEDRKTLDAAVSFEIALPYDDVRFTAAITYELRYEFDEPLGQEADVDEAIKLFAERNPRYNAWPYLRQYVNHMLSYAALPSVVLPLLKPFARPDSESESISPSSSSKAIPEATE